MARIPCFYGCLLSLTMLAGCCQLEAIRTLVAGDDVDKTELQAIPPEEADAFAKRQERWQAKLEKSRFEFREKESYVKYSLAQYEGEPKIEIGEDENHFRRVFKVIRDGKAIVKITSWGEFVFRVAHGNLYLAVFVHGGGGCDVTAFDMRTGKKLWRTRTGLEGVVGPPNHSAYGNQVTMDLGDKDDPNAVVITGREGYGDYVRVLDQKTGQVLAKKVYRLGWG